MDNKMKIQFLSKSQNEGFARVAVASFVAQLDPTLEDLNDIKTAVSEAVTNSIIHAYQGDETRTVKIECEINDNTVLIKIIDDGVGIKDIEEAVQPLYTSKPELERSGMGFTVMETFMDKMIVDSKIGIGTTVILEKEIK